jgi:predicted ATP-grasp superfamily ATP-dependent carboligase
MTPAIVLGGDENALSVGRNLARAGVPVYHLNRRNVPARFSRRLHWIDTRNGGAPRDWKRFLLGNESDYLAGAVVLACSDEAIELIADNFDALSSKFTLETSPPPVRRRLLDKLATYECARDAGIPVPGFWCPTSPVEIRAVAEECRFPAILKPRLSYEAARLGRKHVRVGSKSELIAQHARLSELGISAVVMEVIPGGDDLLCSYYTYIDKDGEPALHFTKRVSRRYPVGQGRATYHETTWMPEVAALGLAFFRHAGLRGLGNVEFKRDTRDGKLKLIESNARFTAADALVTRSGIDLANFVYERLTGNPRPVPAEYKSGMVLWYPLEDFLAFLELRRRGTLSWSDWMRSAVRTDLFPYFRWDDPLPSLVNLAQRAQSAMRLARTLPTLISQGSGGSDDGHRGSLPRGDGARAGGRTGAP